jgi:hypothetical protein
MRASGAFVLGAIVGAAVVWLWGREIEEYVEETARGVRTKAAEGVRVLDRGGDALRRVGDLLRDTKAEVAEVPRAE